MAVKWKRRLLRVSVSPLGNVDRCFVVHFGVVVLARGFPETGPEPSSFSGGGRIFMRAMISWDSYLKLHIEKPKFPLTLMLFIPFLNQIFPNKGWLSEQEGEGMDSVLDGVRFGRSLGFDQCCMDQLLTVSSAKIITKHNGENECALE